MQLNPARGRKLDAKRTRLQDLMSLVYAAQPREGTETSLLLLTESLSDTYRFMQLNPARGRKHYFAITANDSNFVRFMQLNPARGRKRNCVVLIISTYPMVYAAQPREGTETR